ncbi:MAG: 5-oxoprolinase subunit PxpA [Bacteroidota bacterium]
MNQLAIDLNCDMGESYGNYHIGNDDVILPYITSANVACGFHGGDPLHIETTIKKALQHGVQIGAHPGFPDLQGFGRRRMSVPADELRAIVKYQIAAVKGITESLGGQLAYVKPHGALYNAAADDATIAESIAQAVREVDEKLALMGLADSQIVRAAATKEGLRFIAEAFADRKYTPQGRLQSRQIAGSVHHDPQIAAQQVVSIAHQQRVKTSENTFISIQAQSICIHGDNPSIKTILQTINALLETHQIQKRAF